MTKNKYLTNQQFLSDLEKRLSDFTEDEIRSLLELTLMNTPNHYQEKLLQLDPQQVNNFIKKSIQQVENKKTDKQTQILKQLLDKNPKKKQPYEYKENLNLCERKLNKERERDYLNTSVSNSVDHFKKVN